MVKGRVEWEEERKDWRSRVQAGGTVVLTNPQLAIHCTPGERAERKVKVTSTKVRDWVRLGQGAAQ